MQTHWHFSIENVVYTGLSAIVVIHLIRFAAAQFVKQGGGIGQLGEAIGAVVNF